MAEDSEYIPRGIEPFAVEAAESARITAIVGPRQAGKSTLLRRLVAELGLTAVTFDDDAVRSAAERDPYGFLQTLGPGVAIDELQRVPAMMLALKRVVDEDPRPGSYVVTGSADLRTLPGIADALPGRVDYLRLDPLAEAEFARSAGCVVDRLFAGPLVASGFAVGRPAYAEALLGGGFPEARRRSARARIRYFDGYVTSLLERDVRDVEGALSAARISDLLHLVAARSGEIFEPYAFGRELEMDGKTARAYAAALERLFILRSLPAWSTNLGARVTGRPKTHLADTGLLAFLLGADADAFLRDRSGQLAGRLLESFVVNEVLRQATWAARPVRASHYRDSRGREVDLVLERGTSVVGIEVKAATTVDRGDARHLAYLRDRLGDRFVHGFVVYTGSVALPLGDRLQAIPAAALWRD